MSSPLKLDWCAESGLPEGLFPLPLRRPLPSCDEARAGAEQLRKQIEPWMEAARSFCATGEMPELPNYPRAGRGKTRTAWMICLDVIVNFNVRASTPELKARAKESFLKSLDRWERLLTETGDSTSRVALELIWEDWREFHDRYAGTCKAIGLGHWPSVIDYAFDVSDVVQSRRQGGWGERWVCDLNVPHMYRYLKSVAQGRVL